MKCLATYSGSTWVPVNHRARFEVQAPQVRDSGLPSAAVKMTSGLSSALALRRASVTLVSQGISRHGLSPRCGLISASSRSKSAREISGTGSTARAADATTFRSNKAQTRRLIMRPASRLFEFLARRADGAILAQGLTRLNGLTRA